MRQAFVDKVFADKTLIVIQAANNILEEYNAQGLVLTLRQLYYQFVARGLLPNKQSEYKRLGSIINDARLAGYIDWSMLEDRTRYLRKPPSWESPSAIMSAVAKQYREDLWASQTHRPEVWIEKDALIGVIERACDDLRVPYFACRGYASQTSQYDAGMRLAGYIGKQKQSPIIFHLGDHDPSGMDMTRDNKERVRMFMGWRVPVIRLALNMDQIQQYNPPPNPAKETDSRSSSYINEYGTESWELDALEPSVIDRLIRDAIEPLIDRRKWNSAVRKENINRGLLKKVSGRWEDVKDFLK